MESKKADFRLFNIIVVIFFVIILAVALVFQLNSNRESANASCSAMVIQIEDVFESSESSISSLMNTLKEEYVVRAHAVSYILENGTKQEYTTDEYREIAKLLNIDEIHVFSPEGVIIKGTNPEYIGYGFDSGDQIGYFRPMLDDYSLSMCQDVTPNTAEGKQMMYAITWMSNREGMIQVGITPEHLLEEMRNQSLEESVKNIPVVNGMDIYILSADDMSLAASTDDSETEEVTETLAEEITGSGEGLTSASVSIGGRNCFISYDRFDDYYVAVTMNKSVANKNVTSNMVFLVLCLIAAFLLISYVIRKSVHDITESQKELSETDNIIRSAGLGVWKIRLEEGKKPSLSCNSRMMELLGIENDIMSDQEKYDFWFSRVDEDEIPSVISSVEMMKEGNNAEITYRWMHPELGCQYVRCGGNGYVDGNGYVLRGYHYNVTDEVQQEKRHRQELSDALHNAQKASEAKTVFLNNMSHDIRTPLNAVIGFTDIALRNIDDRERVSDCLEKTKKSGEILLDLINDILEMSSIENDRVVLHERYFDICTVFDEISPAFSETALSKEIDISFSTEGVRDRYIYADVTRLFRILINVINNAIKYTENGGRVKAAVSQKPGGSAGHGMYEFVIEDDGIGMSEEFQRRLFERFSREDYTIHSFSEGTGLGLAVTKAFVDKMGGEISVKSKKGEGSVFTITIPFRLAGENEDDVHSSENKPVLKGLKVLLVEDNELNREIARTVLSGQGIEADDACDGRQCLDMLEEKGPDYYDLVLMDIRMPVMNGYEATREIRKRYSGFRIPVIALSANAFEEDRQMSRECGMDGHIAKPIVTEELINTISEVLYRI